MKSQEEGGGELAKQIVRCLVLTLIGRCALNGVKEKSITRECMLFGGGGAWGLATKKLSVNILLMMPKYCN